MYRRFHRSNRYRLERGRVVGLWPTYVTLVLYWTYGGHPRPWRLRSRGWRVALEGTDGR